MKVVSCVLGRRELLSIVGLYGRIN
ncbi:hypothetical protein Goklo_021235 [Gossypium klotzschianum]|uniref:Uncharacterized protein n=1 Tax=Gossypium klotzschianum TaxID=34286 RepID=A0A7J8UUT7_9ROSI|nr:hypothetical protein [Gossypium klotzschianum]